MTRKKLLIHLTSLIFFVFIINLLVMKFHWYYTVWWIDMIMHFIGGIWLGLALVFISWGNKIDKKLVFEIILGVFLIGAAWEIFEVFVNNYTVQEPFNSLDTISDIFFDLAGGTLILWYFIFSKKISYLEK